MSKNCLETHCRNSGDTQTSLSFSFPEEAKQTKETGLEAGDSEGKAQWARGRGAPSVARRPPQRPGKRAAQGRGGRGTQSHRLGALGPAIARVQGRGEPSSLRTQGLSSPGRLGAGMAVGERGAPLTRLGPPSAAPQVQSARPSRKPVAEARGGAGAERPEPREGAGRGGTTGCRPRGGCCLVPTGCRSDEWLRSLKKKKKTAQMAIFSKSDFPELQTWCLYG